MSNARKGAPRIPRYSSAIPGEGIFEEVTPSKEVRAGRVIEATGTLLVSLVAQIPSLERMGVNVRERTNVGGFADGQRGYPEWHQEYVFFRSRRIGDAQS